MYTYINVFQHHVTLLAIYILGTDLRAAFGRTSSAILVCVFHWQRRVMSINIFLCTLRLLYMYNIQVHFCQIKAMQGIYICIVSILCMFTCM